MASTINTTCQVSIHSVNGSEMMRERGILHICVYSTAFDERKLVLLQQVLHPTDLSGKFSP